MERSIDIANVENLNAWVSRSIGLFQNSSYLDDVLAVYPLEIAAPERIDATLRRNIIMHHQARNTNELINLLLSIDKFPYEDPIWYMIKNIQGCLTNNPLQCERIANSLYAMTAEETVVRLESAPKLNTQIGPMFSAWLRTNFQLLDLNHFRKSGGGIFVLNESEEVAKNFLINELNQNVEKRPDLVAKVNNQYVIGEAKWIGQPGGNQDKQVEEVLQFCRNQRGNVLRIGLVDGFPWSLYNTRGNLINFKTAVLIQESEYNILSALLLEDYLDSLDT
jgi:hypothetical protein